MNHARSAHCVLATLVGLQLAACARAVTPAPPDAFDAAVDVRSDAALDTALDAAADVPPDVTTSPDTEPAPDVADAPDAFDAAPDAPADRVVPPDVVPDVAPIDAGPLPAPRPIAPLSTATVTTPLPLLRWSLPAGVEGAHVELCRDRGCTLAASFDAVGTSGHTTRPLEPGVWYWRIHARDAGVVGADTSATWEFTVPRRPTSVDSSSGSRPDVNGDGRPDLVIGGWNDATQRGNTFVYLDSPTGLPSSPSTTLTGLDGVSSPYGWTLSTAGDFNGDGFADVVVLSTTLTTRTPGGVFEYFGGPAGLAAAPAATLVRDPSEVLERQAAALAVGDLDGDGYADLVVGRYVDTMDDGEADVYRGGPSGLSATPAFTIRAPDANSAFGSAIGISDFDGDGDADVVITAPRYATGSGRAYVFVNDGTRLGATPAITYGGSGALYELFGTAVAATGDLNADGYPDLVLGADGTNLDTGRAYVYLSGPAGLPTRPTSIVEGLDGEHGSFGVTVGTDSDVDGDGFDDLVVGAPGGVGHVRVFRGGSTGVSATPAWSITGPPLASTDFGGHVASVRDLDGDGYDDVAVSAFTSMDRNGSVYVYLGSASGLSPTPTRVLDGPDGALDTFGIWVSSRWRPSRGAGLGALYAGASPVAFTAAGPWRSRCARTASTRRRA